jgi:hypothetical protein
MYSLKVSEFVIVGVYTDAKEQASVASINNLVVAELDKVALVFLVPRSYETVYFAFEFDFFFILFFLIIVIIGRLRYFFVFVFIYN